MKQHVAQRVAPARRRPRSGRRIATLAALLVPLLACDDDPVSPGTVGPMPDLSGLAWIAGDTFVAVHDAKNPAENERPRVSLLRLPTSLDGVAWEPVDLDWPEPLGPSSDLESAARIPGTSSLLLLESGEGTADGTQFARVFVADYREQRVRITGVAEWPVPVQNVEGSAVARVGGRLVFLFAERAQGQPSTTIRWAELELEPLAFGAFQGVPFTSLDPVGPEARPVSALEVDDDGRLYAGSAFDSGDDNGPFRSVVWRIGRVTADGDGNPQVVLEAEPERLADFDGLKVESVAVRTREGGSIDVFAGTDDENYGGVLRLIPPRP